MQVKIEYYGCYACYVQSEQRLQNATSSRYMPSGVAEMALPNFHGKKASDAD